MRHKKKRSHPPAASNTQQIRNPERLDYSDGSSVTDVPLDSQEYQRAIRAHLNEFEDLATNTTNAYSSRDRLSGTDEDLHPAPRLPPLPSVDVNAQAPIAKSLGKKSNKASAIGGNADGRSKDRIWNTTTNEERERIKEFWLNLGEEERKSLVKVEKEAVLKKMKEQQKHSCSCSVCGRKRTAIEEELEVLYDAYYEELELYANQQQFPSQSSISSTRNPIHRPARPGKITEVLHSDDSDDSFEDEDDLSEDDLLTDDDLSEEEEDYSDEEYDEDHAPPEFFKFGNSLTVKGGILTVADDLLKNDGKKFIEMMEQLAERRMQREEEAAMEAREYDEEEDDDYDDDDIESEDYEDDDEEQDALTEEQRMAEGRRMFQIFAARMFEQRVLTAYREKVAQERQAQLLQELELEDSREKEREAKKLKEKEKKKDKKRQQQLKKEEEKARKESEKLAEEAAIKAEEERKAEETRKKKEEQRLKREMEKKAAEAERLRKEEEKRKRVAEEKAREAKKQEQAAKEKKAKEETLRKERESKETAAREAKAKKDSMRVQREIDAARSDMTKAQAETPSTATAATGNTRSRILPATIKTASPAVGASPAVPKGYNSTKDSRQYQDPINAPSSSRNIPVSKQQQRTMTPGPISPQYNSHQNTFPRAALGHPPSMPVPLPPPGIGGSHSVSPMTHDPFGFNSSQQNHSQLPRDLHLQGRPNGHTSSQIPGIQGPPGVFASAPGLTHQSTSPQSRIGTPQGARLHPVAPFNAFSGLGAASAAPTTPRDEILNEPELTFPRRSGGALDNNIGAVGAIGRPSPARTQSLLPAPIQRPTSIAPQKRSGFDTKDVMGSRALLDDDDPVIDDRMPPSSMGGPSIFNASSSWTPAQTHNEWKGSSALNGTIDEPYHPPPGDRWVSAGAIGVKTTPTDTPLTIPKSVNWGF